MNRYSNNHLRESLVGGRNIPVGMHLHHQHRRGHSLTGSTKDTSDENHLDLFSKSRRSLSVASSDDSSDGN